MTILQPLGFFRELDLPDWNGSIHQTVNDSPAPDQDQIVAYLHSGVLYAATTHIARDVLSDGKERIGAPHLLTDGRWVWPATLAHYVQRYHCRLPEAFNEDARAKSWEAPDPLRIDVAALQLPKHADD